MAESRGRDRDRDRSDTATWRDFGRRKAVPPLLLPGDTTQEPRFDHEKLDVYHASLEFLDSARERITALPRGRSALDDQLERASASLVLNTAEGSGAFSRKEKARVYRIALRSATECAAILDVARRLDASSRHDEGRGNEFLHRMVATRSALIHKPQA